MEPKRVKRDILSLRNLTQVVYQEESKWITLYCCITFDCDTPILEALLFTTYTYLCAKKTGWMNKVIAPEIPLRFAGASLITDLYEVYPAWQYVTDHSTHWHVEGMNSANYAEIGATLLRHKADRMYELEVLAFAHVEDDNPVQSLSILICRDSFRLSVVVDDHPVERLANQAVLSAILEEQLTRFSTVFQIKESQL